MSGFMEALEKSHQDNEQRHRAMCDELKYLRELAKKSEKYHFHVIALNSKGQPSSQSFETESRAREEICWLQSHSDLARILLFHGEKLDT